MESITRAVQRIDERLSSLGRAERRAVARSSEMTTLHLQAARQSVTAALLAGRLHADEASAFLAALDTWTVTPLAVRVATLLGLHEASVHEDQRKCPRMSCDGADTSVLVASRTSGDGGGCA